MSDTLAPAINERPSTTLRPNTWNNGRTASATSVLSTRKPGCACICSRFASSEPCVSIAGFGAPAVPAVKSKTARSLAVARDRRRRVGGEVARVGGVVHEQRNARVGLPRTRGGPDRNTSATRRASAGSTIASSPRRAPTTETSRSAEPRHHRRPEWRGRRARTRARCRPAARPDHPGWIRVARCAASRPETSASAPNVTRSGATTATPSGSVLAACRRTAPRFTARRLRPRRPWPTVRVGLRRIGAGKCHTAW